MGEIGSLLEAREPSRFELLFEIFPDFLAICGLDGRIRRVNPAAAQAIGYSPEELVGVAYRQLLHPEDLPRLEEGLRRVAAGENAVGVELRIERRDGTYLWIEHSAAPLEEETFLSLGRDITHRRALSERLHSLLESVPEALLAVDERWRITWLNGRCERFLKTRAAELEGRPLAEVLTCPGDLLPPLQSDTLIECEALRGDGSHVPVEVLAGARTEAGQGYLVSLRDATRRRRAEETLNVVETALGEGHEGYWIHDAEAPLFFASEEAFRILGAADRADADFPWGQVRPEDRPKLEAALCGALGNGQQFAVALRIAGEERERVVNLSGRVCRDADGRARRTMGVVRDVTAHYEVETSLRRERDLNAAILETTGAVMVVLDRDGRVVRFNPAAERLSGYRFEEMRGRRPWEVLVPPERAEDVKGKFERLRQNGGRGECKAQWRTREGELRSVVWSDVAVQNDLGEVEYVICTGIDMTRLREAQERLAEAEERNRRLVDLAFDIVLLECCGTINEINEGGARLLGAPVTELAGLPIADIIHPDHRGEMLERIRKSVEEQRETPLSEQKLLRRDGSALDVEFAAIPVRDNGCAGTLIVFRDISERKRAEAALRAREHHFQTLTKVAPVGIYEADSDGDIIYANEHCISITGLDYREFLGSLWKRHLHPDDRDRVLEGWERAVRGKAPFSMEYRFLRPDGGVTWVLNQATTERDEEGVALAFVGTMTDITRNKLDEQELLAYREELERRVAERTSELAAVNRELESFSYSVSHDLRAPLRAINGFGAALWEEYRQVLDEQGRHYLQRMRRNTEWMGELIDGILELSRLTQAQFERRSVDLSGLAHAILTELRSGEPQRRAQVRIGAGMSTLGDERLLRIMLQNLFENAWKYTSKKEVTRIEFDWELRDGQAVFWVKDNGAGFDPRQAHRLFRAFQRLHSAGEFEGSGIGLATVQRIVHRHGGEVWAEGVPGEGASVYFTLPPREK